jgi:membrane-bound serine protease (ClpP class)
VGPNTAFLLLSLGVLALFWEFLRPGLLFPGLLGATLTLTGGYWLWRNSPGRTGILLIGLAVFLLVAEALWNAYFIPGILGTVSLLVGFCLILQPGRRITPALSVPVCLLFGAVSIFLAFQGKQARRNKWSDL